MKSLASRDSIERRDAVRRLILRLADREGISQAKLGRATDHDKPKMSKLLHSEGKKSFATPLADLVPLTEQLGPDMLQPFAEACGYTLVPDRQRLAESGNILDSLSLVMRRHADVVAAVSLAIREGALTADEGERIDAAIAQAERDLRQLRAKVSLAVTPEASGVLEFKQRP